MILLSTILWCLLAASFGSPTGYEDQPLNSLRGEYLDCNVQNAVDQLIKSLCACGDNCCQPFMIVPVKSANSLHCHGQLYAGGVVNQFSNIRNDQTVAYSQDSEDLTDSGSNMKTTGDNEMNDVIRYHTQPGITIIKDHGMTNPHPIAHDIHYHQTIVNEEEEKPAKSSEGKPYKSTDTFYHGEPEKTIMNDGSSRYSIPNIGNDQTVTYQQISKDELSKHSSSSMKPTGDHQANGVKTYHPHRAITPIKDHHTSSISPKIHHTHDHGQTIIYPESIADKSDIPDESSRRKPYHPTTTYHSEPEKPIINYENSMHPFSNNGNHPSIVYPQYRKDEFDKDDSSIVKSTNGVITYRTRPAITPIKDDSKSSVSPKTHRTHDHGHTTVHPENSKDKPEPGESSGWKPYKSTTYHAEPEKPMINYDNSRYPFSNKGNHQNVVYPRNSKDELDKDGSSSSVKSTVVDSSSLHGDHQMNGVITYHTLPVMTPENHGMSSLSPKTHHTHDHRHPFVHPENNEDKPDVPDKSSHRKPYTPTTTYHAEAENPFIKHVNSMIPFSNNGNNQNTRVVYPQNNKDKLDKNGSSSKKPIGDHQTNGVITYHTRPAIKDDVMTNPIPNTYGTHFDQSVVYSENNEDKPDKFRDSNYWEAYGDNNRFRPSMIINSMNSFPNILDAANDQIPYSRGIHKNELNNLSHFNRFGDYYRIPGHNELRCDCHKSPLTHYNMPALNRVSCLSDEWKLLTPCIHNIITINVCDSLRSKNSVGPLVETPCYDRRGMATT